MLENINVLCHSSIRMKIGKTIYIDPFNIDENYGDADYIFITHDHYDHYSNEDIKIIKNKYTTIIIPKNMKAKVKADGFLDENIITVEPNGTYYTDDFAIETIPAYNINKSFHPKENGWVGYIIEIKGTRYYVAGDTDATEESKQVNCDVAFVPVGGTYTMDYKEASELVNTIKPVIAIPIHYGSIVGSRMDAENFVKLLDKPIKSRILM